MLRRLSSGLPANDNADREETPRTFHLPRSRPPVAQQSPTAPIPANFIDALLAYTVDPSKWENLAEELEARDSVLRNIDPREFLAALSKAEALAWQLQRSGNASGTQPLPPHTDVVLFDTHGTACTSSLTDDATVALADPANAANVQDALGVVQRGAPHALATLTARDGSQRFGYAVPIANLPAGLAHLLPDAPPAPEPGREPGGEPAFALLLPESRPTQEASDVLQASFNLTSAERAICTQLATGAQLKEAAARLNISVNTARNQLQAVFEKTGLNRQNDLLLLMTQVSVIVAAMRERASLPEPPTATRAYPELRFSIIALEADPRRIAYRVYGEGRRQVLYFHESVASSSLQPDTDRLASDLDLRIVAAERPGAGFSDPQEGFTFGSVARDMEMLLDDLGIDDVALLGFLSGGAYAISTALHLRDRVSELMLVSARAPVQYDPSGDHPLAVLRRKLVAQPWLLKTFLNILRSRAGPATNGRILKRLYGAVPRDDEFLQSRPDILEHMVAATLESLTVSAAGVINEISCFTRPSHTSLDRLTCPVTVWHGANDVVAQPEPLLAALEGVDVHLRMFPEWGSLLCYAFWPEILTHLSGEDVAGLPALSPHVRT